MDDGPRRGRMHVWLPYAAGVGSTVTVTPSWVRADPVLLERAVAEGFVEAMGSIVDLEDTPGGGLTVCIALEAA